MRKDSVPLLDADFFWITLWLLEMAESQLNDIFYSIKAVFKVTSTIKTDNKTPDQLVHTQQLIFLKINLYCITKTL